MTYATEHLVAADGSTISRYFLDGAEVSGAEYAAAVEAALAADFHSYLAEMDGEAV
jgi:hypothetical protein